MTAREKDKKVKDTRREYRKTESKKQIKVLLGNKTQLNRQDYKD